MRPYHRLEVDAAKKLDYILRAMGSHWMVLSSNDIIWFYMKHAYGYLKMESRGRGKNWEIGSETSQERTCSVLDYSIFGELENWIDLAWPRTHFKSKVYKIYWWIGCRFWVNERHKGWLLVGNLVIEWMLVVFTERDKTGREYRLS